MKTLIATLTLCAVILLATTAYSQDSNSCVQINWDRSFNSDGSTMMHDFIARNNCSWEIYVHWRGNDFGQSECGPWGNNLWLRPGQAKRGFVLQELQSTLQPTLRWCADAIEASHPDHKTCGRNAC